MDPGWEKKSTIPGSRNTAAVLAFSCCSQSQGHIQLLYRNWISCTFGVENVTLQGSWIRCAHVPAAQQWLKTWVRRSSWNTTAVRESQRHGVCPGWGDTGVVASIQIAETTSCGLSKKWWFSAPRSEFWRKSAYLRFPTSLACKKSWPMAVNNPQQKFPNVTSSCQAFVSYKTVPTMPTTNYVFSLAELWWTMDKRWINTDPKSWYPTKRLG